MMEQGKCGTCRFWDFADDNAGECHRFPPVVPNYKKQEILGSWDAMFPETQVGDWCGEWRVALTVTEAHGLVESVDTDAQEGE